nr:MAG: ORF1 [Torque teno virus]
MAWSWWWRRRKRWWPRRRRRWRRLRARRTRRAVPRRGRRRRVRRRRWGRRRRRRRVFYKRRRRKTGRLYRKPKKKLVLTQWHPTTVRNCSIRGLVPLVLCGHTQGGRNFALRSDDYPKQGSPYGGSFSTTTWNLRVLYDEHQKHHNTWSYPNNQLDLVRYKGCTFYFYRDKKTDYIVKFQRRAPFKINKYSSPMAHPGMMMLDKMKILVPSFDTRPGGRRRVKVTIRPPTLLEDKWYTQQDLAPVNLVSLVVSAASFIHPFSQPQTNNICTTFQVLKDMYYDCIGVNSSLEEKYKTLFEKLYSKCCYFETFQTIAQLNPGFKAAKKTTNGTGKTAATLGDAVSELKNTNGSFYTGNNSTFGCCTYKPSNHIGQQANEWFWHQLTSTESDTLGQYGRASIKYMEYHTGIYSSIFLSPLRSNLEFATAYQDVTYNPLTDRCIGNRIWYQYSTKPDTTFNETQCKCVLTDLPLWSMFYGYVDFIESELGISAEIHNFGIVCVQCPYTFPPMFDKSNPEKGYVFYDTLFGNGKMPDGSGHVPTYWQQRWWPRFSFQRQVMHDIILTGPFSYKDDSVMTGITAGYKFRFSWGGDMVSEQVIKNPDRADGRDSTYPGRQRRDLQVVDPRSMGPQWVFHTFDYRRGLFGKDAIKRVSEKPTDPDYFTTPYKKPRFFPPTAGEEKLQEEDYTLQEKRRPLSPEEGQTRTQVLQQQVLESELQQQQELGEQLRFLLREMFKTQAGIHMNPRAFQEL